MSNLHSPLRALGLVSALFALFAFFGCGGSSGSNSSGLQLSRASISFGSVALNIPSIPMDALIVNGAGSPMATGGSPQLSGNNSSEFSIASTTCSNVTLQPQGSCFVRLVFTPLTLGTKSATLSIGSLNVALTGTGVSEVPNVVQTTVTPTFQNSVNALYVNVTICVPSTDTCQTIPNVLVDNGSNGLRLLASAISIPLPSVSQSQSPLASCAQFADLSYGFGPIKRADIKLAGELASNIPIQVMNQTGFAPPPSSCVVSGGEELADVASLGGNGILGIGSFEQDCGLACQSIAIPGFYYACTGGSCDSTTVPLSNQLQNPVANFLHNNNGFLVTLPSISSIGSPSINGQIIFGIGTQSNNQLGSAAVFTADIFGHINTVYNNTTYSSFFDTGSNGLFFLTASQTGLQDCGSNFRGFYCNPQPTNFTVTNIGENGVSQTLTFNITGAQSLITGNNFVAFNNLGGSFPGEFDFGLSFFYGRRFFVGIENRTSGNVQGPFYAY